MDAWETFNKTIEKRKLVVPGDRILLAVSGGPDSVSLMHVFWRLRKRTPIDLFVVHLNHGLRSRSVNEAKRVEEWGARLDIPTLVLSIPVKEYAATHGVSLETAGRLLRYKVFFDTARALTCTKIATGHTANDNAETVLMWLIRGTGPNGLAGIPFQRQGEGGASIIRPLLEVTRAEILEYTRRQKLSYCIDESNRSLEFTRNRIRHKVIPLLETFNPRIVRHLLELSGIVARENEFLAGMTARAARKAAVVSRNRILLDLKVYFKYNNVIQLRLLKGILTESRSAAQLERLHEWILSGRHGENRFSRTWKIVRTPKAVVFRKIGK